MFSADREGKNQSKHHLVGVKNNLKKYDNVRTGFYPPYLRLSAGSCNKINSCTMSQCPPRVVFTGKYMFTHIKLINSTIKLFEFHNKVRYSFCHFHD